MTVEGHLYRLVLGAVIARLRKRRARTQLWLAHATDTSQTVISRIEAGRAEPGVYLYENLAAALGISSAKLTKRVVKAQLAVTRAARAVCGRTTPWLHILSRAEDKGIRGLIAFVVATHKETP